MLVSAFSQPYVYPGSLPTLDIASSPFVDNLVAVYKPSSSGRGYVSWQKARPDFASFTTLEPGGAYIIASEAVGYNLPDAILLPGETVVDLTAPFAISQFGDACKAWFDGQDASQQLVGGGVRSKGSVPLSLLPGTPNGVTYDSTKQALLVGAGGMQTDGPFVASKPCLVVVYTDTFITDSVGFVNLGDANTGFQTARTSYGADGATFQVNTYGRGGLFVDFPVNKFGIVIVGNDGDNTYVRVNGAQPYAASQQAPSMDGSVTLSIGGAPRPGYVQTIHEIILVDGYYTFLAELLEGFTHWKWGMMSQLPAGHPFKDRAPVFGDYYDPLESGKSMPTLSLPPKLIS
jgi:hypothetical protein